MCHSCAPTHVILNMHFQMSLSMTQTQCLQSECFFFSFVLQRPLCSFLPIKIWNTDLSNHNKYFPLSDGLLFINNSAVRRIMAARCLAEAEIVALTIGYQIASIFFVILLSYSNNNDKIILLLFFLD